MTNDNETYFQIFKLADQTQDWFPQHLCDLQGGGMFGGMVDASGSRGFAWILNWPLKYGADGNQVTPWGTPKPELQEDADLFSLLLEHDIPALEPASLKLLTELTVRGVRIIDPPERAFPYYRGQHD
jgi:hypothetical protein